MRSRRSSGTQSILSIVPVLNSHASPNRTQLLNMHSITAIVLIASLALCAADVSHLSLSRSYLPPLSTGAVGGYPTYSTYPSYRGNSYSSGGYYSGSGSGSRLGSGYSTPLINSGYNSYSAVPQYNSYVTPASTYLPPLTGYSGSGYSSSGFGGSGYAGTGYSGLGTKYAANGGYIY